MGITRRSESNLLPFFHLALGRAEAKKQQEIASNQFAFEEQTAIGDATFKAGGSVLSGAFKGLAGKGDAGEVASAAAQADTGLESAGGILSRITDPSVLGPTIKKLSELVAGSIRGKDASGGKGAIGGVQGLTSAGGGDRSFFQKVSEQFDSSIGGGATGKRGRGGGGKAGSSPGATFEVGGQRFDLGTPGGRAVFQAAVAQERATVSAGRRSEAATVADDRDFRMKALADGALEDFAKPGYSQTQKENLASLQTARNIVVGGTAGGGGSRLSPSQQRQALAVIDQRTQDILDSPGMIPLTQEEIAARKVPTTADVISQNVTKGAVEYGLDRNGRSKVQVDHTDPRFKVMEMARAMLAGSRLADGRDYDDLSAEERTEILAAQFDALWKINSNEEPEPLSGGGADPSSQRPPDPLRGTLVGGVPIPSGVADADEIAKRREKSANELRRANDESPTPQEVDARVLENLRFAHPEEFRRIDETAATPESLRTARRVEGSDVLQTGATLRAKKAARKAIENITAKLKNRQLSSDEKEQLLDELERMMSFFDGEN